MYHYKLSQSSGATLAGVTIQPSRSDEQNAVRIGKLTGHFDVQSADLVPLRMTDELTDLDRAVIEALSARYACGGEAAFDEAASRLVVAVWAVLAHARGTARLRDLISLMEAVNAVGGRRPAEPLH